MSDQAPPLTVFSSRAQDPNWDAPRRRRAQPYQAKMNAWKTAHTAWRKAGKRGAFPAAPTAPEELRPYIKGVGRGDLAKRLPLPLRAAVAVAGPSLKRAGEAIRLGVTGAGRAVAKPLTAGRLTAASVVGGTGLVLASAKASADKKNAEKRKAMFGLRKGAALLAKFFDESKVARDDDGKFAPKGGSKMTGAAPRPRHVASIYARGPQWEDRPKAEYDWARSVRPTKDMPFATRQAYAAYRGELDRNPPPAPKPREEITLKAPDLADLPVTGRFKEITRKPQIPSTMTEKEWVDLGRWAKERLTSERDAQILRSIGREDPGGHKNRIMIPVGTDPKDKDVRLAFNVARDLAMHDVGLYAYDHKMTPETIQALNPYRDYIKHTRRFLGDILRREKKGTWGVFRDEFGTEFKDGRVRAFDTKSGGKAGEKKKAFARHMHFIKSSPGGALAKALTPAEQKQRVDAARASAAARAKQRQQPTARMTTSPGREYAAIPERHGKRAPAERVLRTDERLRNARASYTEPGRKTVEGVFVSRKLSRADAEAVGAIDRKLKALRPVANNARAVVSGWDRLSDAGPRWRHVGLAPEHWTHPEDMQAIPPGRAFTGRRTASPLPTGSVAGSARRWARGVKIGGAVAGAAALAGAAYGLGRWRESRKAA